MARLIIHLQGKSPAIHEISGKIVSLGRAKINTIPLPDDSSVSRLHCRVERDGERYHIADSGSRNGTRVNGEPIGTAKRVLGNGDRVQIGGSVIIFEDPNSPPSPKPPPSPPSPPPPHPPATGLTAGEAPVESGAADTPETRVAFGDGYVRCGKCGATFSTGRRKPGDRVGCARCRTVYVLPKREAAKA